MESISRRHSIRVVLTGSESTGKSSLAEALARRYDAELVPEFVRSYAEQKGGPLDFSDHGPIARGQMALEDAHLSRGARLVVQDTDLLSTVVYCRHYFGRCPAWIEEEARRRRPDVYLLCGIDVPWIHDGVRDRGDRRDEMQALFEQAVSESETLMVQLAGPPEQRLELAIDAVERALDDASRRDTRRLRFKLRRDWP